MSASVAPLHPRRWQAYCHDCQDGINTTRQVDAHIWASTHNREKHALSGDNERTKE